MTSEPNPDQIVRERSTVLQALIQYVLLKADHPLTHEEIQRAIERLTFKEKCDACLIVWKAEGHAE